MSGTGCRAAPWNEKPDGKIQSCRMEILRDAQDDTHTVHALRVILKPKAEESPATEQIGLRTYSFGREALFRGIY